jgi:hypothetical protein
MVEFKSSPHEGKFGVVDCVGFRGDGLKPYVTITSQEQRPEIPGGNRSPIIIHALKLTEENPMKKTKRTPQNRQLEQDNPASPSTNNQALQSTNTPTESLKIDSPSEPKESRGSFLAELQEVLGIADTELLSKLIAQAAGTAQIAGVKEPNDYFYPLAVLRAIGPKDELEAILAVQMVGTHSLGMEFLRRASNAEYATAIDSQLNRATKLLKLYGSQLEMLIHHRGGGQQKMVVEHVRIHRVAKQ